MHIETCNHVLEWGLGPQKGKVRHKITPALNCMVQDNPRGSLNKKNWKGEGLQLDAIKEGKQWACNFSGNASLGMQGRRGQPCIPGPIAAQSGLPVMVMVVGGGSTSINTLTSSDQAGFYPFPFPSPFLNGRCDGHIKSKKNRQPA